ncbi:MAG: ATP-binding protein [Firmicutes bacterium]|nr:ATP-binding protein [Bacillota bacterium]
MVNKSTPIGQVKDIYWVVHFIFFTLIIVLGSVNRRFQDIDINTILNLNIFLFVVFVNFFIVNYLYLKATKERFSGGSTNLYQSLYTIVLTLSGLIFSVICGTEAHNIIYVIPVVLVSLTCGSICGLISATIFSAGIVWQSESLLGNDITIMICLLLLGWLVGQISQVNFQYALQLEKKKIFLSDLIETFTGGIVISNSSGEILLCNKTMEEVFAFKKNEVMGKGESLLWQNCSVPFHKWMPNFINMELEIGEKSYLCSRFTLADPEQGSNCFVTVVNDITEIQQHKAHLQRFATLSAVGELAAGAAHEIRNPLTTVRGFMQLLREKWPDHRLSGLCELATEELDRINVIVDNMLQLAKKENIEWKVFDINEIISEIWELYTCSGSAKGISYFKNLEKGISPVSGNCQQIKQVLLNLIQNAEKACSKKDTISIKTYQHNGQVCIEISDTGRGISPEHIDKVFHPFYTTDPSGTGMGLAICNRIISDHNGSIKIKSRPGVGSTFTIYLKGYTTGDVKDYSQKVGQRRSETV